MALVCSAKSKIWMTICILLFSLSLLIVVGGALDWFSVENFFGNSTKTKPGGEKRNDSSSGQLDKRFISTNVGSRQSFKVKSEGPRNQHYHNYLNNNNHHLQRHQEQHQKNQSLTNKSTIVGGVISVLALNL
ncbi:unnamed protein product [Orchesella dallaii]|uniref:Uncharacterized protein n=1 Tax=Orchesella dallaii TaxID=48710 RepID=A0ABP1REI7_9HEXA